MRKEITRLFEAVGKHYAELGLAGTYLHQGHDVHAYYRLFEDNSKVIHVQGYPGMSDKNRARVWARLMDCSKIVDSIERIGEVNGNEHDAVIQTFSNFGDGIYVPYDSKVLEEKLTENVQELRCTRPIMIEHQTKQLDQ